jgi:hypothetical protein
MPAGDERLRKIGRVMATPEQHIGPAVVGERKDVTAYWLAFDHDVRRGREQVRTRQRAGRAGVGHLLGQARAQNPDRPVVDGPIDVAVDHHADLPTRHRAIEDQSAERHHGVGDVPGHYLKLVLAELIGGLAQRRCSWGGRGRCRCFSVLAGAATCCCPFDGLHNFSVTLRI